MAKVAQQNSNDDAATKAERSLDVAARTAGSRAVAETDRLARAASGNGANEAATLLDILGDQTRHAVEATAALGRARSLGEAVQVQSDFLNGSFGRMGKLNERALAMLRHGMMSLPSRR